MSSLSARRLLLRLRQEWRQFITIRRSERRWEMAFCAALASGLPMAVGAWFGRLDHGLLSSLGGLAFLYLPDTPMHHRMVGIMASTFGLASCFAMGAISHPWPGSAVAVLTLIAMLVTMVCRVYRVAPPGSLFFVMAAAIGAYSPTTVEDVPLKVGLVFMGGLLATLIAFVYSLHILRVQAPQVPTPPVATFEHVVPDGVTIGLFVGLSLILAEACQLNKPYWVPVSCLAVIQGLNLRAVWDKQLQRILGTCVGLLLAWGLLQLPLNPWTLSVVLIGLTFLVETLVVRHYGLAVIFITPLTILLADAPSLGQQAPEVLVHTRLADTVLGSLVGLLGGWCLHQHRSRQWITQTLHRLVPARLRR